LIDLSSVVVVGENGLLDLLDMKNVRLTSGGREANFSCPFPGHTHGDERPSAYMNVDTTLWWCFGCHSKGNAISFVAQVQQVSQADAQRWLRDTYGIEFVEPQGGSMVGEVEARFRPQPSAPTKTRPSRSWVLSMKCDWWDDEPKFSDSDAKRYMFDRGFSRKTLEEWEAGYDFQTDRIAFPVYDADGGLIGIKGRAWKPDHQPKYWVVGDVDIQRPRFGFHPYDASEVVYGLHRRHDVRTVVLGEGELNAWACSQVGVERPCALGMSYMSEIHARLLSIYADECVLFFDPDKSGRNGVEGRVSSKGEKVRGALALLEPHMTVRVVQGHEDDAAELLKQGRGSEILELIERAPSSLAIATLFG
jgi:DNA primase